MLRAPTTQPAHAPAPIRSSIVLPGRFMVPSLCKAPDPPVLMLTVVPAKRWRGRGGVRVLCIPRPAPQLRPPLTVHAVVDLCQHHGAWRLDGRCKHANQLLTIASGQQRDVAGFVEGQPAAAR